ncbi:MAG: putative nucleotidyltransferase substrate binding domain-containing protein [Acidimicrobiales bacterium]
MVALPEITDFLRQFAPFAELDDRTLDELSQSVEIEYHPANEVFFSKGEQPLEYLRVVRAGSVEVVSDGEVLDLMGPGEMFGHASMLSGLPPVFEARAAEDTLTFRIPTEAATQALSQPRAMRYMTRLILEDRHHLRSAPSAQIVRDQLREPVRAAIRTSPLIVAPTTTVREAARQMASVGASAFIVELGDTVGIVTDNDLRSRVVAEGLPPETPVSAVMTSPAMTVAGERPGSEVLLDMLDHGVRHFPVTSANGKVIGIVDDRDLVAVESRSSFFLRRTVARASTVDELVETSKKLRPAVVAMSHGGVAALDVMSVFSVVADALTRRALDLATNELGESPARFTWLALGSQARREALPSSDLDSAVAWVDDGDEAPIREYLTAVTTHATSTLVRCGFRPDEHMASASATLFVRPLSLWRREAHSFLADPTQEKALILASVLVDSRPVWGDETGPLIAETFRLAPSFPRALHLLAQFAISHKPPVGFLRGLAVEFGGERRSHLDLKSAAVVPITDLARWAGMTAGVACASTAARLEAASDEGTLSVSDAQSLLAAFELVCQLRLDHQVRQLDAGEEPDDVIVLSELSDLTHRYLKEAFRAVASVQRRVANDLSWTP